VGATVTTIPSNAQTVVVNETTNNYYYGGSYYQKDSKGYTVVAPTAGTIVESLPEGGEEVTIGNQKYVKFGQTYYQPIQQNGKDVYEVAQVEEDK
jgi:predicted transcriptional regulator YdeE